MALALCFARPAVACGHGVTPGSSSFALAHFAPAAAPTLQAAGGEAREPLAYRRYAPCLDGRPVRLRGDGGLHVEPLTAEARLEGVFYVFGAGPDGQPGRAGLVPWDQLRGLDVWEPGGGMSSKTSLGAATGFAIGVGVMLLATEAPGGFGDLFYPLVIATGAAPFGLLGAFVGSRFESSRDGHWQPCHSWSAPYGAHAALAPPPAPAPGATR